MSNSSPATAPSYKAAGGPAQPSETDDDPNYKWKVLISVIFGIFMIILDSTVVNVAFQTLRREFGGSIADSQWVLSIYVLALGITTPVSGFLGDRFGTKRIYLLGLSMFAFGSFLCGVAPSLFMLILARALQGIGGGIAQPLGPAMIYRAWPMNKIGTALGYFGLVLTVAPALGPMLGGYLVDANLWRLIFFINVPIGILGVFLGSRFLRNDKSPQTPKLDPIGLVLSIIGFGSVLYAASVAASNGWTAGNTLLFFSIGIVALIAFAIVELYVVKDPMLNLRLFKNRIFTNATVIGYVATVALFGAEFLMPLYLQAMRGRTAIETGTILLGVALASGITTQLAGRLYDRIGPRPIVVLGFAILIANTWQLARIEALTPMSWIVGLLILRGLGVGLVLQTTFTTAMGSVPRPQMTRGSSLQNSTRFVIQAVAVAALATVLSSTLSPQVREQQDQARASGISQTAQQARFGACETPGVAAADNVPSALAQQSAAVKQQARSMFDQLCRESIAGFERTYQITFYASIVAFLLSFFLPGWPGAWAGRAAMQSSSEKREPVTMGGH